MCIYIYLKFSTPPFSALTLTLGALALSVIKGTCQILIKSWGEFQEIPGRESWVFRVIPGYINEADFFCGRIYTTI